MVALLQRNADVNAKDPVCARETGWCSRVLGLLRLQRASERRSRECSCRKLVEQHCTSRLAMVPGSWLSRCSSGMLTSMLGALVCARVRG